MNTMVRDKETVDSFVRSMEESIKFFSKDRMVEDEIHIMAERLVNELDFDNEWQMHKGLGYFAMKAVNKYLTCIEIV